MQLLEVYILFFFLFIFGIAVSVRADEEGLINETGMDSIGEVAMDAESLLMHMVPSEMTSKYTLKPHKPKPSKIFESENELFTLFMDHVEKGHTQKTLTFNIYDDHMREATIVLFRLICNMDIITFRKFEEWASQIINGNMLDYAKRLCALHSNHNSKFVSKVHDPPFLSKSNLYINGETVVKYFKLRDKIGKHFHRDFDSQLDPHGKQFDFTTIVINTNYSGWNIPQECCGEKLDYFTEDIGLNAFYYGMHLMHPFWMSNNELDFINPRQAEHYYFNHKQLWARYELEKESAKQRNVVRNESCDDNFNSYLIYDNGLPFPIRSKVRGDFNEDRVKLYKIDINIKELLSRGFLVMNGGMRVNLTEDNFIELIAKMIKANYDSISTAKISRNLYGYGHNGYPKNTYHPAPSLLHQPDTNLRDPGFWELIKYLLQYHKEFSETLPPLNMSDYETEDFEIVDMNISKLTTFFENYQFEIFKDENKINNDGIPIITARQRRLTHLPWHINFAIKSNLKQDIIIRIFLGPPCGAEYCWKNRDNFFLLDIHQVKIKEGFNKIIWNPKESHFVSLDNEFNREKPTTTTRTKYNMFKFPQRLLLPKGEQKGVNMTIFVIATVVNYALNPLTDDEPYYNLVSFEYDTKPIGFPLHMPAINFRNQSNNYRFYNVTIYHKKRPLADDGNGYFSPHLY